MYSYPFPYFDYTYYRSPVADAQFINQLAKAINGEFSAITCYEQLAKLAPNEAERKQINEIRKDEIKHLRTFSNIYTSLTGKQPTPSLTEKCPTQYKAGVEAALKDEQETVDFYNDMADQAKDPAIKEAFRRAALDEQNHAVWFLYFYTKQTHR